MRKYLKRMKNKIEESAGIFINILLYAQWTLWSLLPSHFLNSADTHLKKKRKKLNTNIPHLFIISFSILREVEHEIPFDSSHRGACSFSVSSDHRNTSCKPDGTRVNQMVLTTAHQHPHILWVSHCHPLWLTNTESSAALLILKLNWVKICQSDDFGCSCSWGQLQVRWGSGERHRIPRASCWAESSVDDVLWCFTLTVKCGL